MMPHSRLTCDVSHRLSRVMLDSGKHLSLVGAETSPTHIAQLRLKICAGQGLGVFGGSLR